MLKISATKLRQNLFDYLNLVANGETIIIERHHKEVARIISMKSTDWRNKMTTRPEILVLPDQLIKPIDDVWEDYT